MTAYGGHSNTLGSGPQSIQNGIDHAKKPGLPIDKLSRFLRDIDFQPAWRGRADVEADYGDGNQLDGETLQSMREKGLPPIVIDLISPSINLVTGMEQKARQDLLVRADEDGSHDFAMGMTKLLQQAERDTSFDYACSEAYAHEIKVGLGWTHVRRQRMNPFGNPYVVESVHRREIWWDWMDMTPDLSRARFLVRRKWYDFDVLYEWFPQHKRLIDSVASGWSGFDARAALDVGEPMFQDYQLERDFVFDSDTWRNMDRMQGCLYEVWYRVPRKAYIITLPGGIKAEFNQKNPDPLHVAALSRDLAQVEYATLLDMRLSWWLGPHRLADKPSPLPHNEFPYIPWWGYREDRTGVPYGMIRSMRPLQDEVNARRARMLWQLSARRIIGFSKAVRDKRVVEQEAARPDAAIWLDGELAQMAGKSIGDLIRFDDNPGLNAQQMAAYQDAAQKLQDVSNVFKEQLGKGGGADSGIAISQLIEQGTTALASLNAHGAYARSRTGQQLFTLIKEDIGTKETEVVVEKGNISKKRVKLNERKYDAERNITYRDNDVQLTKAKVVLDSVPASASFRQYQLREIVSMVKQLPENLQGPLARMVIDASDVPHKDEMIKTINETLGISDPDGMSPEEQAAYQQKAEIADMMQQLEVSMAQLAAERADLENRKVDAETEKIEAETDKTKAEAVETVADTNKTRVEAGRLSREPIRDPNAQAKNTPKNTQGSRETRV